MGRSNAELRCKKHPLHTQSPGVCSFCLKERLTQLSAASHNTTTTTASSSSSSSLSSSPYSSASSSYPSPLHHRFAWEPKGRVSFFTSGNGGFQRSRSVLPFAPRKRVPDALDGRKRSGFWSKLLRSTTKRTKQVLMHSRTMRDNRVY